jgi:hypothetical protein
MNRSSQDGVFGDKIPDGGAGLIWKSGGHRPKTKKPAAGGGAAGFSKRTEQRLGGGVPLFLQTSLGGGVGRLKHEALREEVHCFDENHHTPILSIS